MSNVYILEPPTSGKVLLKTTVGDIDIELWSKEAPKTCRNFIQLCLEGYYDNTIFHRIVRGFIAQGGDPNGDGTGGESVYGEPFKDEFHQRLKFTRRGLVAMANAGKDDNGSQFFFTLAPTPELNNLHTIFGKVTGETIFNVLRLEEGLIKDERPVYPHKILKAEVLHNPFSDIIPRILKEPETKEEKKKKEKKPGVKNFKLLSFGTEAEEDEEESTRENEKFAGKGKSTHDILDDPKLSKETEQVANENEEDETEVDPEEQLENIRKKLKKNNKKAIAIPETIQAASTDIMDAYQSHLEEERQEKRKKKYDEIRKEINDVKKEYHKNKLRRDQEKVDEENKKTERDGTVQEYLNEYDKYKSKKDALPKKGASREAFTLQLLDKFKKKIQNVKEKLDTDENKVEKLAEDEEWFAHRLSFEEKAPTLAKDANRKDDDWFEIYDPRNTLNKRRRGEAANKFKK